jgi:SprT-like family
MTAAAVRRDKPTTKEYNAFQHAYDVYNDQLFNGTLPDVMVTLQRHPRARGYFHAQKFGHRKDTHRLHELALNPDTFDGRSDEDILSTLAHEMCHVWQETHGTPPRRCYHDKEFAAKMKAIGLHPSHTGEPGGKETGQNMTHYIVAGGPFATVTAQLLSKGYTLQWQSRPDLMGERAKKAASKTKYTCPDCEQNVWGKPETNVWCGDCSTPRNPVIMEPAL